MLITSQHWRCRHLPPPHKCSPPLPPSTFTGELPQIQILEDKASICPPLIFSQLDYESSNPSIMSNTPWKHRRKPLTHRDPASLAERRSPDKPPLLFTSHTSTGRILAGLCEITHNKPAFRIFRCEMTTASTFV